MQRAELLAFVRRDRAAVEALRAAHWRERHRVAGPLAALELADQLRRYAISVHPGWPDQAERDDDLTAHRRVAEALRRVGTLAAR
jgi:hypothetical protein